MSLYYIFIIHNNIIHYILYRTRKVDTKSRNKWKWRTLAVTYCQSATAAAPRKQKQNSSSKLKSVSVKMKKNKNKNFFFYLPCRCKVSSATLYSINWGHINTGCVITTPPAPPPTGSIYRVKIKVSKQEDNLVLFLSY